MRLSGVAVMMEEDSVAIYPHAGNMADVPLSDWNVEGY